LYLLEVWNSGKKEKRSRSKGTVRKIELRNSNRFMEKQGYRKI